MRRAERRQSTLKLRRFAPSPVNQLFTVFRAIWGSPEKHSKTQMRTPQNRSKLFDHILNDSEEARYWAENCNWEPGSG